MNSSSNEGLLRFLGALYSTTVAELSRAAFFHRATTHDHKHRVLAETFGRVRSERY